MAKINLGNSRSEDLNEKLITLANSLYDSVLQLNLSRNYKVDYLSSTASILAEVVDTGEMPLAAIMYSDTSLV